MPQRLFRLVEHAPKEDWVHNKWHSEKHRALLNDKGRTEKCGLPMVLFFAASSSPEISCSGSKIWW